MFMQVENGLLHYSPFRGGSKRRDGGNMVEKHEFFSKHEFILILLIQVNIIGVLVTPLIS